MNTQSRISPTSALILAIVSMCVVVVASNVLVQYKVNDWITWGTLTFPIAFLVTDLANRYYGVGYARWVVLAGFIAGVIVSPLLAPMRIAMASGFAFLIAQLLDVSVFDKLRHKAWWIAPFVSTVIGAALDTYLFYGLAFHGVDPSWPQFALGDLGVKWLVAAAALIPYALLTSRKKVQA